MRRSARPVRGRDQAVGAIEGLLEPEATDGRRAIAFPLAVARPSAAEGAPDDEAAGRNPALGPGER